MTSFRYRCFEWVLKVSGAGKTIGKALARGNIPSVKPSSKLAKRWTRSKFKGRDIWTCRPKGSDTGQVYIHQHGGAYAIGLIPLHFAMFAKLSDMSGATIILPDYPLPPNEGAHGIIEWAAAQYQSVVGEFGSDKVRLGGDSAGGNLALAISQKAEVLAPLMLMSPWVDLDAANMADDAPNAEILLEPVTLKAAGRKYAGDQDSKDPLISPIFAEPNTLSDVIIFAGEKDLLFGQIMRFAETMKAAGKLTKLATYGEFGHYWMFYPVPDRESTLVEMAAILARKTS